MAVDTESQLLNVGVVGLGRMGSRHANNFFRLVPRARLTCVCTPAPHEQQWAIQSLVPHGVKLYKTYEEMLADPGLQAVVIASSTVFHVPQTIAALDKGIHVLCEKPIAHTADELEQITQRMSNPNMTAKLMVAFMRRFDDDYQDALQKIRSGRIGRPIFFRSHQVDSYDREDPVGYEYLRTNGGTFIDAVIHDIDLSLMFMGEDSVPKSVTAIGTNAVFKDLDQNGDADNAIGIVEYWGGKLAHFYNSRTATHGYDNETQIYGLEGKLAINGVPRRNRVELSDGRGIQLDSNSTWYDRYVPSFVTEANAWVEALLDGKDMPVPLATSLKAMRIAESLQESLRTGKKIDFSEDGKRLFA